MPEEETQTKVQVRRPRRRWLRRIVGILLAPLVLAVLAVCALYIPGVLNLVAEKALPSVEKSSGLHIEVEDLRLRWPLRLEAVNALVLDMKAGGDTMVSAAELRAAVNPLPLLHGDIAVSDAELRRAFYQTGAPDSLYISAHIDSVGAAATLNFARGIINVDHADLNGGRVLLIIGPDTTETPKDTTATSPLLIKTGPVTLRNVDYRMSMALTNDTIAALLDSAALSGGELLIADTLDIRSGALTVALRSALYGQRGVTPVAGLDLRWITADDARARVDSFKMHGLDMTVPLTYLKIKNIGGLALNGSGTFAMDSAAIYARGFDILADRTRLRLDATLGLDSIPSRQPLRLTAGADIYPGDIVAAMPAFAPMLKPLPAGIPLTLRAFASGTMAALTIDTLEASMRGIFSLRGSGHAENLTDPKRLAADAFVDGSLINSAPLSQFVPEGVKLPPLSLRGTAKVAGDSYAANLTGRTGAGRLALKGSMSGTAPAYDVDLRLDSFPVAAFVPDMGIGAVTASVKARGRMFNPLRPGAAIDADVHLASIEYRGRRLGAVDLTATLAKGDLRAELASTIPAANLRAKLNAVVAPKSVHWDLSSAINLIDLNALGITDSIINGRMDLTSTGFATLIADSVSATATARDVGLVIGRNVIMEDSLTLTAETGRRFSTLKLADRTLSADFHADAGLQPLLGAVTRTVALADSMVARRNIDADSLSRTLPTLNLALNAQPGNLISRYLKADGMDFRSLQLTAANDSALSAHALLLGLSPSSTLTIDTITADIRSAGSALTLDIDMGNRPGTFDEFASVCLRGYVNGDMADLFLRQKNLKGETGYMVGMACAMSDSLLRVTFTPTQPVIAYKKWKINPDNFVEFNPSSYRIRANLDARGDDSRLQLLTAEAADTLGAINEVRLKISDIHIQDWLSINPFAPPVAGDVSADLLVNYTRNSVNGKGTATLANLTYGRKPVGTFDLGLDVATDFGGAIHGSATLDVDGRRAMAMRGALNDTTQRSPLKMELTVTEFPLSVANPFVADFATLSGALNGNMDVTGTFNAMKLNGALNFSRSKIKIAMMGSSFSLDSVAIPVDSNFVKFNDFAIRGSNSNPLTINGTVDLRRFADPRMDLSLHAANMMFCNSKKARHVELYGKGYMNLDAKVNGSMNFMRVDADLAILPQTNLTYQITDARTVAGLQPESDMVRFVNFADTSRTQSADTVSPGGTMMILTALVDIRQGSTFTVDLSSDGKNRAQIKGDGILDYTMSPTQPDGRLTGRFTINSGFFRYSLPVISEKLFTFSPGSYVAFNGPILNPTLNIHATDQVRANVTRQGENSRLVDFDVALSAAGTLERMDVAFDLSTKDDITVQNELQSMSPAQRANQAMNLLLYGVYTGQGTTGNANLSGNALYGFLTSQLNTWAANTIKGVDLTFGMDQYDRTRNGSSSTATQYSYKVSKSLFNDRFKIVVGGNYSTDADEQDNIAENLISDISLEYMLNQSGSMYVRLFRHTGYESILEGEVTQTGVGFVVKRKIRRLADIFNFIKAAKQ